MFLNWVTTDLLEFKLTLQNPLKIDLIIDRIELIVENAKDIDYTVPETYVILPNKVTELIIKVVKSEAGGFGVKGVRLFIANIIVE